MEKIKKIEIKSRPKEDKSGYEVTIETPQKFDEVVCNSRAEKNGFLKGKQETQISPNEIVDVKIIEPKGYSFHYVINLKLTSGYHEIVFFPHEKKFYLELLNEIRKFRRQ